MFSGRLRLCWARFRAGLKFEVFRGSVSSSRVGLGGCGHLRQLIEEPEIPIESLILNPPLERTLSNRTPIEPVSKSLGLTLYKPKAKAPKL